MTGASPVRHVVLDVGRVLLHWDPDLAYRDLVPDDAERAWFLAEVCGPAWNTEQDRGRSWAEGEAEAIARFPDQEVRIRAYRPAWARMVPHPLEAGVAVYEALLELGTDVTLLTNFAADTWAEACRRFPVLRRARGVTVSGEVGLVKPDPGIYRHHAASFDLDPAATLFVDDSPANVEGARAAGWSALLYADAPTLRADLRGHGLDLEPGPATSGPT
ncbi:HAD family hydrolase [Phycicoccus flavus]|uniref:HAD family hydrolase n=1 Tax=Phycicoccus flavus TaxID=2502783 RepID=UPI000FEC1782|nr:HAD family phosphatase [Phycicoccus flavus]NHA69383.1 HAD family phosphatase [Phycicoccus flavus]